MCTCTSVYVYVSRFTCASTEEVVYVCIWLCVYMGTCVYGYVCIWLRVYMGTCLGVRVRVCMGTCVYGYVCIWVRVYMGTCVYGYMSRCTCLGVRVYMGTCLGVRVYMFYIQTRRGTRVTAPTRPSRLLENSSSSSQAEDRKEWVQPSSPNRPSASSNHTLSSPVCVSPSLPPRTPHCPRQYVCHHLYHPKPHAVLAGMCVTISTSPKHTLSSPVCASPSLPVRYAMKIIRINLSFNHRKRSYQVAP